MSLQYGFYNAKQIEAGKYDRVYDATQLSSMFDGIIGDGFIRNYGGAMKAEAGSGTTVNVLTGRAWFNHTWTYNDSALSLDFSNMYGVTKYIILEVNRTDRTNSIKIVDSYDETSETTPQHPIASVYIPANATSSSNFTITDMRSFAESIIEDSIKQSVEDTNEALSEYKTYVSNNYVSNEFYTNNIATKLGYVDTNQSVKNYVDAQDIQYDNLVRTDMGTMNTTLNTRINEVYNNLYNNYCYPMNEVFKNVNTFQANMFQASAYMRHEGNTWRAKHIARAAYYLATWNDACKNKYEADGTEYNVLQLCELS